MGLTAPMPRLELRPYQAEAVARILGELREHRSTLLVMPTGTGKTRVFAAVARRVVAAGRRALVLAHRQELLEQARSTLEACTGARVAIEKAEARAELDAPIVVASVQSLHEGRRARFPGEHFGLVVVDEAHHAPATSYRGILDHFAEAKVLGVTATPDRGDGAGLGAVFDSVAFEYGVRDAIAEGYLAPIRQRAVYVEGLDLRDIRQVRGDFAEAELEAALLAEAVLHEVAVPLLELAGERRTLCFAAGVKHAHALAEVARRYGARAEAIDGGATAEERAGALEAFAAGRIRLLVNCALLTEGFDDAGIEAVAVARPTRSRAFYAQMIGRGTRLHPGKADLLVLDFRGNAGRHALVSAVDVLAGAAVPEVKARAAELAEGGGDVLEALDQAEQEHAEAVRRATLARARFEAVELDPFEAVLGGQVPSAWWAALAPTEAQLATLERAGVPVAGLTRGRASAAISAIVRRREQGLCSFKQARLLARFGLDPDATFEEASRRITELAANGWRRPRAAR